MTYRVYIIRNEADRRYIGLSENIYNRLAEHNHGKSKWTSKYRPWTLFWESRELPLGEARKLENLMKRQKGGKGLETLMENYGTISGS